MAAWGVIALNAGVRFMKYMGSKAKIAKSLLGLILKNRTDNQVFVEPFVGGCNVIDKVVGERIGCDNNKYLIAMYKYLQNNPAPNFDQSKQHYNEVRQAFKDNSTNNFEEWYIGHVGFMASANGRFFDGGYSGVSNTKIGTTRNYIDESIRGLKKQLDSIKDVNFVCADYKELIIPANSIVYCDPPYANSKKYSTGDFNSDEFWDWCRVLVWQGHRVFVSEYNAPPDFKEIWAKEITSSLRANNQVMGAKKSLEKLFKHESQT
jgi:DNA adenine methylase